MADIGFSGGAALEAKLREIAEQLGEGGILRVGFLETEKYPDGTNVAQVAYWNEYGTTKSPPRPFFRQMISAKSSKWGDALGRNLVATGYNTGLSFNRVGELIKDQLRNSIIDFQAPGLSAYTIAKKGSDKPLVDTGQMLRAPAFDITDPE